jgi:DNA-binding SARP family transcriptional activator
LLERLIEIEPKDPRGYTGLAEAYIGLDDTKKAIGTLHNGKAMLPGDIGIKAIFVAFDTTEPVSAAEPDPPSRGGL